MHSEAHPFSSIYASLSMLSKVLLGPSDAIAPETTTSSPPRSALSRIHSSHKGKSRGSSPLFRQSHKLKLYSSLPRSSSTDAKIAAMEARLLAMKASKNKGTPAATEQLNGAKPGALKLAPSTAGLPRRPQTKR